MATFVQIDTRAAVLMLAGGGVLTSFVVAPDASMTVVNNLAGMIGDVVSEVLP